MISNYANDLVKTIEDRNEIEREKLKFEREVFEFNKQFNIDNTKANIDMANTMAALLDKFENINKSVEVLANNDAYLKNEIDKLNVVLKHMKDSF